MTVILIIVIVIGLIVAISERKDIEYAEKAELTSGELRVKYPNFVKAIRSMYGNEAYLTVDNNKFLTYRVAVKSLGSHVGDMILSLNDSNNNAYIIQVYKGFDNVEVTTSKVYLDDFQNSEIDIYINILNSLAEKILQDKRFLASAHSFL